jgi:hypothetical protein
LERVTEFCDQTTDEHERGKVTLRIVFSRRGGLRYIDFANYLKKLRRQSRAGMLVLNRGDLTWSLIDDEEIFVLDHVQRAGLQLADIGAAAFFEAVDQDRPTECDPQYAMILKPIMARRGPGGELWLGVKAMPELPSMQLSDKQREIFEFYGFNPEGWRTPGG